MMTTADRVHSVVNFGFTERQARFLVLVMRHAGVCVPRQYAQFAGVAYGAKCNVFFDRLIRRGYAVASGCIHNRARLYHVHHKPLYDVIGEATSRYRRRLSPRTAMERLMLFDAVLTMPTLEWLTTASERVAHVAKLQAATRANAPEPMAAGNNVENFYRTVQRVSNRCRVRWPYGAPLPGHGTVDRRFPQLPPASCGVPQARSKLDGAGSVSASIGPGLRCVPDRDPRGIRVASPADGNSRPPVVFRASAPGGRSPGSFTDAASGDIGTRVFDAPRFTELYRQWLRHGDVVFDNASSPAISEALTAGQARVECVVLPHSYQHLSPVVDQTGPRPRGVEKGVERGAAKGTLPLHVLNPSLDPEVAARSVDADVTCRPAAHARAMSTATCDCRRPTTRAAC
jgi:hypothetical protein